jgi:hypothetical protein
MVRAGSFFGRRSASQGTLPRSHHGIGLPLARLEQRDHLARDDFPEVIGVDVSLKRLHGFVLLVHHDQVRIVERAIGDIEVAARLGAGWNGRLVQQLNHFVDMSGPDFESGDDGEHRSDPFYFKSIGAAFRAKILA